MKALNGGVSDSVAYVGVSDSKVLSTCQSQEINVGDDGKGNCVAAISSRCFPTFFLPFSISLGSSIVILAQFSGLIRFYVRRPQTTMYT